MSGLRVAAEALFGTLAVAALLVGVDCVKHPRIAIPAATTKTCPAELSRAPMLCNAITQDGAYECAICPDPDRACLTTTHVYCTAAGCNDAACVVRKP